LQQIWLTVAWVGKNLYFACNQSVKVYKLDEKVYEQFTVMSYIWVILAGMGGRGTFSALLAVDIAQ